MSKRNEVLDVAKGVGIILVVIAHAGMPHAAITNRFHMAFFFFLSGMTVKDKYLDNLKECGVFLCKKIKGLYVPFVLFNGFTYIFFNQLIKLNIITDNSEFLNPPDIGGGYFFGVVTQLSRTDIIEHLRNVLKFQGESQLGGATWFLRVLFGVTCTWYVFNYILKNLFILSDSQRMYINICIGLIFVFLAFSLEQNGIAFLYGQYETVMASYLMYILGIYCGRHHVESNLISEITIMMISVGMLIYANKVCFMLGWNCSVNQIGNPYMFLLTSTLGITGFYYLAKIIARVSYIRGIVAWFGRNSLFILLFHFLAFKIINFIECIVYNQPLYRIASFPVFVSGHIWWLIYAVIGLVVSAFIGSAFAFIKSSMKLRKN